jgi:fatty-acyl-CoA synthase
MRCMSARTVAELLIHRHDDEAPGLVFEGESWTWAEVVQECAVRAAALSALRVDGPFHVGVLLENTPEYVFLLGGAALAGATIVGVNPTRRGEELGSDIRHTDCQIVVTERRQRGLLDGLDLGTAEGRMFVAEDQEWTDLLHGQRPAGLPDELPAADALLALIFTSGSTGAPKAVKVSQGRLAATAQMGFSERDVLYCAMPLFHGNALFSNLLPGIGAGARIVLRRRFSASAFLPDVREHGVTFFNTVGRALSYILATPPTPVDRDHRLRFALAPESSPVDLAAFTERFGCMVIEGYSSSEGAMRIVPAPGMPAGALGKPADGADVAVIDPETLVECPVARIDDTSRLDNAEEAIGEIVRRDAGSRFEGYYRNPEAEAERTRNGWYWSGDLGYRDADGFFYFAGRTADWIRVDSENFAASPVERILGRHPDIAGVAVYAVPDPRTGDAVMAAIELRGGTSFDAEGFERFLAEQPDLGTKWAPRFVRLVDALPVTGTNKIDKLPLRAAAWRCSDPIWWRPEPHAPYRPFTPADAEDVAAAFAAHGRGSLLPST